MIVAINGFPVGKEETLKERLGKEIKKTEEYIAKQNRRARRSKYMKYLSGVFGMISVLAITCADKASADASLASVTIDPVKGVGDRVMDGVKQEVIEHMTPEFLRNDTLLWQMNEYMNKTLLHTHDFFNNPSIVGLYTTIAAISLSFLTIIISKKGYDMITSKLLGSTTIGLPELIIRLLCSVVIGFLSLKVAGLGIEASNAILETFFTNVTRSVVPEVGLNNVAGSIVWFLGYILMFGILMVRYWVRQINIVILGLMTPVANVAWITDGGAMLGTLIKEMVVSLTTPLAQGLILAIGSIVLVEVSPLMAGEGTLGFFNQIFIGMSTLFLMVTSPEFLRKFIHGSANPFKAMFNMAMGMKAMPLKVVRFLKK